MIDLKTLLGTGLSVAFVIFLLILFNPDKVEKWLSLSYKALSNFPKIFKAARKRFVKYDLQSRLNKFASQVHAITPFVAQERAP